MQVARSKLLEAAARTRAAGAVQPALLTSAIATLHSYTLVKRRLQLDDHTGAARLLKRVCANISRFEAHAARIMTSAVLECLRAGLPQSAHEIALALMQPEHAQALTDMGSAYKRKIEGVVRFCNSESVRGGAANVSCNTECAFT